jgi:hypothetical protein
VYRLFFTLGNPLQRGYFQMSLNRNVVHESLLRHAPGISGAHHRAILDGLQADGLIDGGAVVRAVAEGKSKFLLSPRAAAAAAKDENAVRALKALQRTLARHNYHLDLASDQKVKLHEVDAALKACSDLEQRMAIKHQLFSLGMIEP